MNDLRSATVTIARATRRDAFAVAAMHLRRDREEGAAAEPGFLDRFADFWLAHEADYPAWLASRSDGDPVGGLVVHAVVEPPRSGRPLTGRLDVTLLYTAPEHRGTDVPGRLLSQAQSWCVQRRLGGVRLRTPRGLDAAIAQHGFTDAGTFTTWSPPAPR